MPVNVQTEMQPSPEVLPVSGFQGREAECLWVIARLNNRNRRSPSLREIADEMKITRRRALDYVERLEDKRFINRQRGERRNKDRSIEINFETVLLLASSKSEQ